MSVGPKYVPNFEKRVPVHYKNKEKDIHCRGLLADTSLNFHEGSGEIIGDVTFTDDVTFSGTTTGLRTNVDHILYVSKTGNDSTGTGQLGKPYLTIQAAITAAAAATPSPTDTYPYVILVSPGTYETDFVMEQNIFVEGTGKREVVLDNCSISCTHASWAVASGYGRLSNLTIGFSVTFTMDMSANGMTNGSFYFDNVYIGSSLQWTGAAVAVLPYFFECEFAAAPTFTDFAIVNAYRTNFAADTNFTAVNTPCYARLVDSPVTDFSLDGFTRTLTVTDGGDDCHVTLIHSRADNIVISGAGALVLATSDSLPLNSDITGSAITRISDAYGVKFTPTTSADWPSVPATVQEALDDLGVGSYSTSTHNTTWSGIWAAAQTGNVIYTKIGKLVTLQIPAFSAVSNAASVITADTVLPSGLRPTTEMHFVVHVNDNATGAHGVFKVNDLGQMVFYASDVQGNFAGAGSSGVFQTTVSYIVA